MDLLSAHSLPSLMHSHRVKTRCDDLAAVCLYNNLDMSFNVTKIVLGQWERFRMNNDSSSPVEYLNMRSGIAPYVCHEQIVWLSRFNCSYPRSTDEVLEVAAVLQIRVLLSHSRSNWNSFYNGCSGRRIDIALKYMLMAIYYSKRGLSFMQTATNRFGESGSQQSTVDMSTLKREIVNCNSLKKANTAMTSWRLFYATFLR